MKTFFTIMIAALTLGLSSCVELPDLNPNTNDNLIVQNVNQTYGFTASQMFSIPIDVNNNGTVDFTLEATSSNDLSSGTFIEIRLYGSKDENKVIARNNIDQMLCTQHLSGSDPVELPDNFMITPFAQWSSDVQLYANEYVYGSAACVNSTAFITYDQDNYLGLRFTDGDEEFFGWINLRPHTLWNTGYLLDAARWWKLKQCAYNPNAEQGLRIPG